MSLIRWQPLKEFDLLRQQMNRLFDDLTHGDHELSQLSGSNQVDWIPAIELTETDTDLMLKAEVPGVAAKDLDVQVSENAISIVGAHHEEHKTEDKGIVCSELRYGQFQRVIPLPVSVKNDQVQAEFKDGMLTLTLPKVESARRNVVKIDLEEKTRAAVTEQRQREQHLQDTAHSRAAEEVAAK
ncbi:MAG: Hsp20/alpha crystallin family protein [Leptolyngbyaceae cyanobacterium CSU_1_3]|nr:Hsp20/alpha crystallin family protein [Leptolyngbyaceae cyanobacterium CSU_1_3]